MDFFTSAALRMAAQSTFSGSTATIGAAVGDGDAEGEGDGLGDAADSLPLALASALPLPLASADPEASAPLDTVTTAVTVRRVELSEEQPDMTTRPTTLAVSSTR
jgi:hypothetical protein